MYLIKPIGVSDRTNCGLFVSVVKGDFEDFIMELIR
jgi:hypothetical protein